MTFLEFDKFQEEGWVGNLGYFGDLQVDAS